MEIQSLHEFVMVAEKLSFSLAANALFTSQSNLSKHIAGLENELDVKLFHRSTRHVSLTTAGKLFLTTAKEILATYSEFEINLQKYKDAKKTTISVLSIPILAQYGMINTIWKFHDIHPEIELKLVEREDLSSLPHEQLDSEFTIMRFFGDIPEKYNYIEFCREKFVAVLPNYHHLAVNDTIHLSALKKENLIFLDKDPAVDNACKQLFKSVGFVPKIKYNGYRPETIVAFVAMGMGISLLTEIHAECFYTPEVVIRDIFPTAESRICMVWDKNYPLSPAAAAFVRYLQENVQLARD